MPGQVSENTYKTSMLTFKRLLQKYGLTIILCAFTVLGLCYDFTVPLFEKPDELKHFALIQHLQSRRELPVVQAGIYQPWDQEATQPPLYHVLAAALISWLDLSDFEEPPRNPHYVDERSFVWRERANNNLYLHPPGETWSTTPVIVAARLARWLSLLAGLGTVSLTYVLARVTFEAGTLGQPDQGNKEPGTIDQAVVARSPAHLPALLAAALVAFIPQFLHVSSAITNDSLSVTLAAATLVILALIIKHGTSTRYTVYLGFVLGLGAITKLSLLYLMLLTGLVYLLDLRCHRSFRRLAAAGAIITGLMILLAGWWYGRNWQVYGDATALNAHLLYRGGPLDPRPTLAQIWQTEMVGLELSFWAAFGAGQILIEPWIYTVLGWVKVGVLVGLGLGLWRGVRSQGSGMKCQVSSVRYQVLLVILALWCLIIFIALLRWMQITPASWGRLLYPALPAVGVLSVWGLAQFYLPPVPASTQPAAVTSNPKPDTYHAGWTTPALDLGLPAILVAALCLLAVISPFRYINSAYTKTPLMAEAAVSRQDLEKLDFVYDDTMHLIGYKVEEPDVQPGDWLPVTLYWQALRPIETNYTAFVHLLNPEGESIGQANTYPDGGNWPTSMLETEAVLKDTYYVPVSAGVNAPLVARLALGIFEFDSPDQAAKSAVNAAGDSLEPIVGAIPVLPRQWPELKPDHALEANFGGQIRLAGYDWPAQKIEPEAVAPLTLYWAALQPPGRDLNLFIHLIDPATGEQAAGFDGPPRFPTGFWQSGNTIVDARMLALPADLPPGKYTLMIGWYNLADFARLPLVGGDQEGDALLLLTVLVN